MHSLILHLILHFAGYLEHNLEGGETKKDHEHLDLPLFDLDKLLNATNNFSSDNNLRQCGFGPVHKVGMYYTTSYWLITYQTFLCHHLV